MKEVVIMVISFCIGVYFGLMFFDIIDIIIDNIIR
jgi:hypothetical protein